MTNTTTTARIAAEHLLAAVDTCDFDFCHHPAETLLLRIAGEVAELRPMCSRHLADAQRGDATNILLSRLTVSAGRDSVTLDLST